VTGSLFPVIGFHQKRLVWTKNRRYIGAEVVRKTTGDKHSLHRRPVRLLGTRLFEAVPNLVKEATMSNRRAETEYESDELLMNDDYEVEDDLEEDVQEEKAARARGFNMDMRHRIEDRLEERRLKRELNDYDFFGLEDDEDVLH
tara:strand:+ start:12727 stop:13158 length:432 start_codon:yes stop_codon:yes gene_type:complete